MINQDYFPNFSFDLCRLACSLYDYFIDDEDDPTDIKNPICKLVSEWCEDDKKRNVLYKKNGEERYPDFKLYKMIARTVNNHTPENQLKRPMFQKYKVSRSSLNKKQKYLILINCQNIICEITCEITLTIKIHHFP